MGYRSLHLRDGFRGTLLTNCTRHPDQFRHSTVASGTGRGTVLAQSRSSSFLAAVLVLNLELVLEQDKIWSS